jgi:D-galactarolactone cycloisomerase
MLGGEQKALTTYASLPRYGNAQVAADLACRAVREGYRHIKLHEVAPDIIAQPSVSKVGGIGEFLKVSDLCRRYEVPLVPHSPYLGPGFLATAHLWSARHPDSLLECIYPDVIQARFYPGLEQRDGLLLPPQAPGPGIDPDRGIIEQYRIQ